MPKTRRAGFSKKRRYRGGRKTVKKEEESVEVGRSVEVESVEAE